METFNEVLRECVKAIGQASGDSKAGSKIVGAVLWPEKPVLSARTLLLNCLEDGRPEKLSPDQAMFVLQIARDAGYHAGMSGLCELLGYSTPTPLTKADEKAELQRKFIAGMAQFTALAKQMGVQL